MPSQYIFILSTILSLYILLLYLFLGPGLVGYIFEKHSGLQKGLQLVAFILAPLIGPFAVMLLLSLWFLKAAFAILFLILAYPLYWLILYFPLGRVLKAWHRLSARTLEFIRTKMEFLIGSTFPPKKQPSEDATFLTDSLLS